MSDALTFPNSQIDPRLKNQKEYILQYAKAAYGNTEGFGIKNLWFNRAEMMEDIAYAMGTQSIDRYKKHLLPDESSDNSWQNINWDVLPIMPKFIEIALAKILEQGINIQVAAIDDLSKSEEDDYFNKMKVKIMMREAAQKQGSQLAESPVLQAQSNEPQDNEELQMEQQYGYKHVMAMDAELALQLANQNNNFDELDKRLVKNFICHGISGLTQWIDENGNVKEREIDVTRLVLSPCNKPDFSDLQYWGEVTEVSVVDIAPYFNKGEMIAICNLAKGQNNNPTNFDVSKPNFYDGFKVNVLDFKFLDWDSDAYEVRNDKDGNGRFGKTDFKNLSKLSVNYRGDMTDVPDDDDAATEQVSDGKANYIKSTKKVTRKCKWIVGSDYVYDFGLSENMVRKPSSWWDTSLDIQLYAWNFHRMEFHGLVKRLRPIADDIQNIWYKMQNLRNKMIPYIMTLDLTAFENVPFGKGGASMKPIEAVDFLMSNFIAVWRSTDLLKGNPNYKPATIEGTGDMAMLNQLKEDMYWKLDLMRQVSGLNEITDGSAPNSKNLNSTNQAGEAGTNNALWPIYSARKNVILRAADNKILKQQIAVKLGKVQGMIRSIGNDSIKMFQINPDISLREFGLAATEAPTDQERQALLQDVSAKESQGLLNVDDKIMIMSTQNLKQAGMLLGYRIRKRQEQQQQDELAKIQQNNQGQQQMIAQQEQLKQQTIQMQLQADLVRIEAQMKWTYEVEAMKKQVDFNAEKTQSEARTIGHQIQADAKIAAAQIIAEGSKHKEVIAGEYAKEKQTIANKKKTASGV